VAKTELSKTHKILLAGTTLYLVAAFVVSRLQLGHTAILVVGSAEMVVAILFGIGFGMTTARRED
jgi:hypothetical protein